MWTDEEPAIWRASARERAWRTGGAAWGGVWGGAWAEAAAMASELAASKARVMRMGFSIPGDFSGTRITGGSAELQRVERGVRKRTGPLGPILASAAGEFSAKPLHLSRAMSRSIAA